MRKSQSVLMLLAIASLGACGGGDDSGNSASGSAGGSGTAGGGTGGGTQALTITSATPPNGATHRTYDLHEGPHCQPGTPNCKCMPGGVFGQPICFIPEAGYQLTASGGAKPYFWKWAAATASGLPPGLALSPGGLIGGSPAAAGSFGVDVTVSDSSLPAAQVNAKYTITITPAPPGPPPEIHNAEGTLGAAVNVPYSFTLHASGGQLPLAWSESGELPLGLSLLPGGVFSGTPAVIGTSPVITVNVQDSAGQKSRPLDLTIVVTPHGFGMTGNMIAARCLHSATLLGDGTVLIAGGVNAGPIANSELYNPGNGTFSPSGMLQTARYFHTATLIGTGQVLIAGGDDSTGNALASAELYDPAGKSFAALGTMASKRAFHTATLLDAGKVLLAGGATVNYNTGLQATAELFDPSTGSFSATGSMSTPRSGHTATLLNTGKVLISGGIDAGGGALASAELYDPVTGTFTPTGSMNDARNSHTATLLSDGTVLITGGYDAAGAVASAEIYAPGSSTFITTGDMDTPRAFHRAVLLGDGMVLVVGGLGQNGAPLAGAELYAPATRQFRRTGGLQSPLYEHTATVLASGNVLVTGGCNASGNLPTAEIYQ